MSFHRECLVNVFSSRKGGETPNHEAEDRMKFRAAWVLAAALPVLAGCHSIPLHMPWHHGPRIASCYEPQPYMSARGVPPLKIPEGLDSPDTGNALVIPALKGPAPPPPKPGQPCLDAPPSFHVPHPLPAPKA